MKRLLLLCCLLASSGCAIPTVIPTGNPITDMVVNVALEEAIRPVITGEASHLLANLIPQPECIRGRRGLVYCGRW